MKVYCILDEQRSELLCGSKERSRARAPIPLRLALAPDVRTGSAGLWRTCPACLARLEELRQHRPVDWRPAHAIPEDHYAA